MAKKFRFHLDQVLTFRRSIEEEKVRDLARAKAKLLEIEGLIKDLKETESDFLKVYGDFETGVSSFDSDQVMAYCAYQEWLRAKEKEYRKREKEWGQEIENRRKNAVNASRARRLLDNLKTRNLNEHMEQVRAEEQGFLDEITSIAFARRGRAKVEKATGEALI